MCHKSRAWPTAHKGGRKAWQRAPLTLVNGKAGLTGPGWFIQLSIASRYSLLSSRGFISKLRTALFVAMGSNITNWILQGWLNI